MVEVGLTDINSTSTNSINNNLHFDLNVSTAIDKTTPSTSHLAKGILFFKIIKLQLLTKK